MLIVFPVFPESTNHSFLLLRKPETASLQRSFKTTLCSAVSICVFMLMVHLHHMHDIPNANFSICHFFNSLSPLSGQYQSNAGCGMVKSHEMVSEQNTQGSFIEEYFHAAFTESIDLVGKTDVNMSTVKCFKKQVCKKPDSISWKRWRCTGRT